MLADNLKQVQEQIASALDKRKNKDLLTGDNVTLVAVTKNHPPEIITNIEALGIANVGENRVQEAKHKQEALGKHGYWHLIGHLQTNKARQAVALFDLIESVDSEHLLAAIDKEAERIGKVQDILLQLNIAHEEQKSGLDKEDYLALLPKLPEYKHVRLRGLMVIAQKCEDIEQTRPVFAAGYRAFARLKQQYPQADILSMGMSNDYTVAIEEGANIVRVGTALFGQNIIDKIMNALSLYDEEEIIEEEVEQKPAKTEQEPAKPKKRFFGSKEPAASVPAEEPKRERKSILNFKSSAATPEPAKNEKMGSKTINLPIADKLMTVVLLEPVNYDKTDNVVAKRMTDFISGTVYAIGGSMKKLGRNIVICAPKNVDIDAGEEHELDERGNNPWDK